MGAGPNADLVPPDSSALLLRVAAAAAVRSRRYFFYFSPPPPASGRLRWVPAPKAAPAGFPSANQPK